MPAYKDEERGTWYVKCYYDDWSGKKKQKKKRGFKKKKEAEAWEKEFLVLHSKIPDLKFETLSNEYLKDVVGRVRPSTYALKGNCIKLHILPYFKDMQISSISPDTVRVWQNQLRTTEKKGRGTGYISPNYIKTLTIQLSAILNFGCKYYGLPNNPCTKTDRITPLKTNEIQFWEIGQFERAMEFVDSFEMKLLFQMLFFGGFRIGELLALRPVCMWDEEKSVSVSNSYNRVKGGWEFGPPKSINSVRRVILPDFLYDSLKHMVSKAYGIDEDDRIFQISTNKIRRSLDRIAEQADLPRLRIHDLRHSHVSYLISLGFNITEIADRIGDTPEIVSSTYAHLYPQLRRNIAAKIDKNVNKSNKIENVVPY